MSSFLSSVSYLLKFVLNFWIPFFNIYISFTPSCVPSMCSCQNLMTAVMGGIMVWGSRNSSLFFCEKFIYRKGCKGKMILESLKIVSSYVFIKSHLYQHWLMPSVVWNVIMAGVATVFLIWFIIKKLNFQHCQQCVKFFLFFFLPFPHSCLECGWKD